MLPTVLLIVCVACIAVAQLFILRSALRALPATRDVRVPSARRGAEVAWAVLPAIALGFVLWMTWQRSRAEVIPPERHHHDGHGAHAS